MQVVIKRSSTNELMSEFSFYPLPYLSMMLAKITERFSQQSCTCNPVTAGESHHNKNNL